MPVSVTSDRLSVSVPGHFIQLVSIWICLKTHYSRQNPKGASDLEIKILSLKLELRYDDMENFHYFKKLDVLFSLHGYSVYASEKDAFGLYVFSGKLDFISKSE